MKQMLQFALLVCSSFFIFALNKKLSPRPEVLEKLETQYAAKLPINTRLILNVTKPGYTLNDSVKFEAVVNPVVKIEKKITGTVTFMANGVQVCSSPVDSVNSKATCTIKNTRIGVSSIVATYNGLQNFYSPSKTFFQYYVAKMPSQIELNVIPISSNSPQNEGWTLSAKMNPKASTPINGTVSFFANTTPIPNCMNKKIQEANCRYFAQTNDAALEFTAAYSGDSNYNMSSVQKIAKRKNGLTFNLLRDNFSYAPNISQRGFNFSVRITGNWNGKNISDLKDSLIFSVAGIKPTENYLMEKAENRIGAQEFKDVQCAMTFDSTKTGLVAKCTSLRPVVDKFDITTILKTKKQIIIGSQTFPITIQEQKMTQLKISNQISPQGGCGLYGTTRQRMFDCSMTVSNFGGRVNAEQEFVPYTAGDLSAEFDWFLVYCPQQSSPQSCSWMSPILQEGNPAISKGEFDTNGTPMSRYLGKRILWSGVSTQTMTFFQANGGGKNIFQYTEYPFINEKTLPQSTGKTRSVSKGICKSGKNLPLLSTQAPYNWQVPSYPMILTLTGGKYCDSHGVGFEQNWQAFCNGGSMPKGARAVMVPSFIKTYLWSSSVETKENVAWIFNGTDGGADVSTLDDNCSVRCASFTW